MEYLICYQIYSTGKCDAHGDAVVTAPDLTNKSVLSMRKWAEKDARTRGFKSARIIFTSITKLDEP